MRECKLDNIKSDCVLYCKKSDYYTDSQKPSFLSDFYNELIIYIVELCGRDKFIEFYNTKNKSNPISKDTYLEKLKNYFNGENNSFDGVFKNINIHFKYIFFPAYKGMDDFDYTKILYKLNKIDFDSCKFHTSYFELDNIEVFFQDCEFYGKYSIGNSKMLQNASNIIYQGCIFNHNVSIPKGDGKSNIIEHALFSDCQFKQGITAENIEFKESVFNNTGIKNKIKLLELIDCTVTNDFILKKHDIGTLNLSGTTFKGKVKIQSCDLSKAKFNNTKFNNLVNFNQTTFNNACFEYTEFNQIAVFSGAVFKENIDFKYTIFLKTSIFKDMIVEGELDLENTIFDDEANFLDIRAGEDLHTAIKVKNRETARIIKNFYEHSNNVIEANKFYALEMQEREKELNESRSLFEWITFKIHSISSNHSQDWVLVLSWIIIFGFISSLVNFYSIQDTDFSYVNLTLRSGAILILVVVIALWIKVILDKQLTINESKKILNKAWTATKLNKIWTITKLDKIWTITKLDKIWTITKPSVVWTITKLFIILIYAMYYLGFYLIYCSLTGDTFLFAFSQALNPFSIMQGNESINIFQLILKIIMAYLIYQFIVSVRQNTRRK